MCAVDFFTLKKSVALAGLELATIGSSDKHSNYYNAEATLLP
jgi:hypothetical protein